MELVHETGHVNSLSPKSVSAEGEEPEEWTWTRREDFQNLPREALANDPEASRNRTGGCDGHGKSGLERHTPEAAEASRGLGELLAQRQPGPPTGPPTGPPAGPPTHSTPAAQGRRHASRREQNPSRGKVQRADRSVTTRSSTRRPASTSDTAGPGSRVSAHGRPLRKEQLSVQAMLMRAPSGHKAPITRAPQTGRGAPPEGTEYTCAQPCGRFWKHSAKGKSQCREPRTL